MNGPVYEFIVDDIAWIRHFNECAVFIFCIEASCSSIMRCILVNDYIFQVRSELFLIMRLIVAVVVVGVRIMAKSWCSRFNRVTMCSILIDYVAVFAVDVNAC